MKYLMFVTYITFVANKFRNKQDGWTLIRLAVDIQMTLYYAAPKEFELQSLSQNFCLFVKYLIDI